MEGARYHLKTAIVMVAPRGNPPQWCTVYMERNTTKANFCRLPRLKSSKLPMRVTREEAQRDLDAWAKMLGLEEVKAECQEGYNGTNTN